MIHVATVFVTLFVSAGASDDFSLIQASSTLHTRSPAQHDHHDHDIKDSKIAQLVARAVGRGEARTSDHDHDGHDGHDTFAKTWQSIQSARQRNIPDSLQHPHAGSSQVHVQAMLYGPAAFFSYPWKPLLNDIYGGGYSSSYENFRVQHMNGYNLLAHVFCLLWHLSANYAFLRALDKLVRHFYNSLVSFRGKGKEVVGEGPLFFTRATTFLWGMHLMGTFPTPVIVKVGSLAFLFMGHNYLGVWFSRYARQIIFVQGFFEAMAVQRIICNKPYCFGFDFGWYLLLRTALWKFLSDREGMLKEYERSLSVFLVIVVAYLATSIHPLDVMVLGLFGWIFGLLTGTYTIYFWSAGLLTSMMQGISHKVTGETGTLELLIAAGMDQTSFQISHCTFFPNLLFQACYAQVLGNKY